MINLADLIFKTHWLFNLIQTYGSFITVGDYSAEIKINEKKQKFNFHEILSIEKAAGLLFHKLVFSLTNGSQIVLNGFTKKQLEILLSSYSEKKATSEKLAHEISTHKKLIQQSAEWCSKATSGDFFISEREKNERFKVISSLGKYLKLPFHQLPLAADTINELWLISELYANPDEYKKSKNKNFTTTELSQYAEYFEKIESNPLTIEQRESIVCDEDSVLVVASAGSGKTSLLVGKVGYLIEKQLAQPHEILILAFNKSAKEEIFNRILDKVGLDIDCHTFHSFGLNVLGQAHQEKPSLSDFVGNDALFGKVMTQIIDDVFNIPKHIEIAANFFISHSKPYRNQFDFKNLGEYYQYTKTNQLITFKGEFVKSFEELEIANYLSSSGINYQYEPDYKYETATPSKRGYKPDFYLPDYDIYIEHFAINEDESTPVFIDCEDYRQSMEWKRELHKKNQTTLIETYSYEKKEGVILSNLRARLTNVGVSFSPLNPEYFLKDLNDRGYISEFAKLVTQFLNLFKSRGGNAQILLSKLQATNDQVSLRFRAFFKIFQLIFGFYTAKLEEKKDIDFHDMINLSVNAILEKKAILPYKYILIDEFQDISYGRAQLLTALQKATQAKLFAVGDDWQSIYSFTGSDIELMTNFGDFFGFYEQRFLSNTFRFNDKIEEVASAFIQKNPKQLSKKITTYKKSNKPEIVLIKPKKDSGRFLEDVVKEISVLSLNQPTSILFLGRNNNNEEGIDYVALQKIAPNSSFEFKTVHRAKGYEADFVVVLGLKRARSGFPNEMVNDPIINTLLPVGDGFAYSEERRLFYVALTRAKQRAYLIADSISPSIFFLELASETYNVEKRFADNLLSRMCPICKSAHVVERIGSKGAFFGCENFPNCTYTSDPCNTCNIGFIKEAGGYYQCDNDLCKTKFSHCPSCKSGKLIQKKGKYGLFWGCSEYFSAGCSFTKKITNNR